MYQYPYGDTQQLNLDWILTKIKELEMHIGSGEADLEDISNALISATFSSSNAYNRSDIVFHNGKLYRANVNIPAPGESWNPAHWDEILLGDTVSNLVRAVAGMSSDDVFNVSNVAGTHVTEALNALDDDIKQTDSDIAIIVNGKRSATGATAGQFVLLRNSTISGKSDGLYVAAANIPANTDIDATYLTDTTGGGLNQITPIELGGTNANTVLTALDNLEVPGARSNYFTIPGNSTATFNLATSAYSGFIIFHGTTSSRQGIYFYAKLSGANSTPTYTQVVQASALEFNTSPNTLAIKNTTGGVVNMINFYRGLAALPDPVITPNT